MKKFMLLAAVVMFVLGGCAKQYQKPEPVKEVKQKVPSVFNNFKTASKSEIPLATIALLPENWPYDKEDDLTYGALTTELMHRGFHIISLNNLYEHVDSKYLVPGEFYTNLNFKNIQEKMNVDAVLVYQTNGTEVDKTSFRLVDASTYEILLAGSYILSENVQDEIVFKAVANELSGVFKTSKVSDREDFNLSSSDKEYYEFITVKSPDNSSFSLSVLNSSWPRKNNLYDFEKKNILITEFLSNKIKVFDENPLYYYFFDKIIEYELIPEKNKSYFDSLNVLYHAHNLAKDNIYLDSLNVLFNARNLEKKNVSFLNKIRTNEISKVSNVDGICIYDINENFKRFNYSIIDVTDGKILAANSVNINKVDHKEELLRRAVKDLSYAVKENGKIIENSVFLTDDDYFYDGTSSYEEISDKIKEYSKSKSKPVDKNVKPEKKSMLKNVLSKVSEKTENITTAAQSKIESVTTKQEAKDFYEYDEVPVKPVLIGGDKKLNDLITYYAKNLKQKSTVDATYIVSTNGGTTDIELLSDSNLNYNTKQAVTTIVKGLKYMPGADSSGKPVKVRITQRITLE